MPKYVEKIKVGSGESWDVRDPEAHSRIDSIWNVIYPVGSIYMSVTNTPPDKLFGGTWEQIQDRFLLAAGSTYAAGSTGGEAEHALTVDEMPTHRHQVTDSDGNQLNYNSSGMLGGDGNAISLGEEWHNMYTSSVGGNQPHNNMPPYLAVYMWKRTA